MSENFPHQAEMDEPYEDGNFLVLIILYYVIRTIELAWSPIRWIKNRITKRNG